MAQLLWFMGNTTADLRFRSPNRPENIGCIRALGAGGLGETVRSRVFFFSCSLSLKCIKREMLHFYGLLILFFKDQTLLFQFLIFAGNIFLKTGTSRDF